MYSWKAIRIVAAILLLIPILHLALLISGETLSSLDTSPQVWTSEVDAYAQADRLVKRPVDPIVIAGGRRVTLWQGLSDLLAPTTVLMRGLGDATVNDISFHYSRLIGFYQPHTVVLLPGNSEFHVRDNKSAAELVAAIRELVELDLSHRKGDRFYVFAPLKTLLYPGDHAKIEEVTRQLYSLARTNKHLEVLDANRLLSDRSGAPKPAYFRADGVNLNELGYTRLSMLLLSKLEQHNPDMYGQL